ncbi:hypothetical protein, partial [Mycobacterium sp. 852002-30065_SCH5024008]|uniref:hypothetical protein n=1 Tax=Mycobacterium sp. 852002-30065_SCH5024008 TaxID=1834088 RepID=UPI000A96D7A6
GAGGGAALGAALDGAAAGTEDLTGLLDFVSLERHMATHSRITATTATSASRASRGFTGVAGIVTSPIARLTVASEYPGERGYHHRARLE